MNPETKSKFIKIGLLCVVLFVLFNWIWQLINNKKPTLPVPPVVVQQPRIIPVIEYVTQTGTLVAYNSVNLVARIEGYLDAIEFTDGTFVKKNQELFIIQPEPYLEQLKAAQATVVVKKATYAYNNSEYERQKRMYKQNATSLNNVEKWHAQAISSKAEIDKSVANETNSAITYSYTHVHAPFDGRIGRHLVDIGNLVGHGAATNLATIEQIDPIYVYFNLNELDLLKLRIAFHEQGMEPADINKIPVYVRMQNETGFPHQGYLNFVNTGLNASTGTMEFRALLSNKDYQLLPGLFVQVRIPINKPTPQLTIPNAAVQYDQIGAYVFCVDKANQVIQKRVVLGSLEQNVRAIKKGLTAMDRVIVSGMQNATPGHLVALVKSENNSK